jgi:hypothetical protein
MTQEHHHPIHRDGGGANCFIFNDSSIFWNFQTANVSVRQLGGSSIAAAGFGVIIVRPPNSLHLLAPWHSYYFPTALKHIFYLNALKHYLLLPSVTSDHTSYVKVTLPSDAIIHVPSIPTNVVTSGLDFFHADVMKPSFPLPA